METRMKLLAAAAAFVMALLLMLVPSQAFKGGAAPARGADIARALQEGKEGIDAVELAKMMVAGTKPLQLVDVREAWAYEDWHLPGAVNVSASALLEGKEQARLSKGRTIVLLCRDGSASTAVWMVLKGAGFDALVLKGGLTAFWDEVMKPACLRRDAKQDGAAAMRAVREWVAAGAKPPSGAVKSPVVAPPASPKIEPTAAPPAARRGGC